MTDAHNPDGVIPRTKLACRRGPLLAWLLAGLIPMTVHAATGDWEWQATLYLWLPSVSGESALPPDGGGPAIEVSADAVLESLNSIFMGALEVRSGPWASQPT